MKGISAVKNSYPIYLFLFYNKLKTNDKNGKNKKK